MNKLAFSFLILFVAVSCNKFEPSKKKGDHYVYNSEDFKNADLTVLGVATSDIDAVWIELYYEENSCHTYDPDRYALVVKRNGELIKELGEVESDWNSYITFTPKNGTASYSSNLDSDKEKITLLYELTDRTEEITFIYKK
jgi:hypothetical protein